MKNPLLAIAIAASLSLTSCAQFQSAGRSVASWWGKPETQVVVHKVQTAVFDFAFQLAINTARQYGETGKVDFQTAAITAGANTLYSQASAIRQIQGTSQVVDPVAIARILEANGTASDTARQIALVVASGASQLVKQGVNPDRASEIQANEFDQAAAFILGVETTK